MARRPPRATARRSTSPSRRRTASSAASLPSSAGGPARPPRERPRSPRPARAAVRAAARPSRPPRVPHPVALAVGSHEPARAVVFHERDRRRPEPARSPAGDGENVRPRAREPEPCERTDERVQEPPDGAPAVGLRHGARRLRARRLSPRRSRRPGRGSRSAAARRPPYDVHRSDSTAVRRRATNAYTTGVASPGRARQQLDEQRRRLANVLGVVEDEQQLLVPDNSQDAVQPLRGHVADTDGMTDRRQHECGVLQRRKLDEHGAVRERRCCIARGCERESRLAAPSRTSQDDQARFLGAEQRAKLLELALASDQRVRPERERAGSLRLRLRRRERRVLAEDACLQLAQPMRRAPARARPEAACGRSCSAREHPVGARPGTARASRAPADVLGPGGRRRAQGRRPSTSACRPSASSASSRSSTATRRCSSRRSASARAQLLQCELAERAPAPQRERPARERLRKRRVPRGPRLARCRRQGGRSAQRRALPRAPRARTPPAASSARSAAAAPCAAARRRPGAACEPMPGASRPTRRRATRRRCRRVPRPHASTASSRRCFSADSATGPSSPTTSIGPSTRTSAAATRTHSYAAAAPALYRR